MKLPIEKLIYGGDTEDREGKEINTKALKALVAVSAGAIWGAGKILKANETSPFLGRIVNKKEHQEYQEKGFLGTMAEKIKTVYGTMSKAEEAGLIKDTEGGGVDLDLEGADWDKIFEEKKE